MNFLFVNVNHQEEFASGDTIPVSMAYILAYLKDRGHSGVILDDILDRPLTLHALEMWVRKLEPAVIGFTTYQSNMERVRFMSRYVKSHHRNILIILGGPQAMFMPSAALKELEDVDIICRGEGEMITAAIAECLENNRPLSSVNGITCREDGEIIDTELEPDLLEDLDKYPSPYLNDIINLEGKDTAMLFGSRGCEHVCLFCITPSFCHKKVRFHSVKRILDEMEYITERGIKLLWFGDPNFTTSPEKTLEILNGKLERGIKTPFWCQTRSDLVDEKMLKKLREAGAETIALGLESGSPGVLKSTGKGIALDHLRRMIEVSQSLGIKVELFSMFGLPGETVEHARETIQFVKSYKVPLQFQQMQLFFGSIYEKSPAKFGFRNVSGYRPSYLSIGDQYETKTLNRRDIKKIYNIGSIGKDQLGRDVYYKERLFDILDLLLDEEEDLRDEEPFYFYGAIASCALEEEKLLWKFINDYVKRLKPSGSRLNQLLSSLNIFKETGQRAGANSRVIFDCRTEMDGAPFYGMNDGFWDVTLGKNLFIPSFEKGLIGARGGEEITYQFSFPNDYSEKKLQGKAVNVWAQVFKVMNPVRVGSIKELKSLNIRNYYPLTELDRLREENDILYYLALKDIPEHDLVMKPIHFLGLVYRYAKLRLMENIKQMAELFENDKGALKTMGNVLNNAGRHLEAAKYYERADSNQPDTLIRRALALFSGGEKERAFKILNSMPEESGLQFQELLLDCLKAVEPDSERIPSLNHHVLDLKVKAAFENETTKQTDQRDVQPNVHGAEASAPFTGSLRERE